KSRTTQASQGLGDVTQKVTAAPCGQLNARKKRGATGQPEPIPVGIKVLDGPKKWASPVLDQARAKPERHGHALDERTCSLKA
ncbi:MAG: hypothetical protein KAZ37_00620, partial [Rhodocyclaceae bacterium]|nr:hypothetical protein [Rhodocyclaceae bacterium]